ncbi:unnamed protein product [Discosporangium mesarthrocarpum]
MVSSDKVYAKVRTIVVDQLGVEESQVIPTASFTQDLGADSLDIVELVMALEKGFEIDIEDKVAQTIVNVQDAVEHITNAVE